MTKEQIEQMADEYANTAVIQSHPTFAFIEKVARKSGFIAGANSQQQEIDELKKENKELIECLKKWQSVGNRISEMD